MDNAQNGYGSADNTGKIKKKNPVLDIFRYFYILYYS